MDSKSFRIYNPAKGNVRESRNVVFMETPLTLPDPAPASGHTYGEFTYEDNDDLLRDVMDYTSYLVPRLTSRSWHSRSFGIGYR